MRLYFPFNYFSFILIKISIYTLCKYFQQVLSTNHCQLTLTLAIRN